MKKLIALVCSVVLVCGAFAGCGKNTAEDVSAAAENSAAANEEEKASEGETSAEEDSSQESKEENENAGTDKPSELDSSSEAENKQTSSAADSSKAESSLPTTENLPEGVEVEGSGEYAAAYTELLKTQQFSISLTIADDIFGESSMTMEFHNNDNHMNISTSFYSADIYTVGGVSYMLDPSNKTYMKLVGDTTEYSSEEIIDTAWGIQEGYEYIKTEEVGDYICETYRYLDEVSAMMGEDAGDDAYVYAKYYFDKASGVIKMMEMSMMDTVELVNITSFETNIAPIALPDLTGWTEQTQDSGDAENGYYIDEGEISVHDETADQ